MPNIIPCSGASDVDAKVASSLARLLIQAVRKMKHLAKLGWKHGAIAERFDMTERETDLIVKYTKEE